MVNYQYFIICQCSPPCMINKRWTGIIFWYLKHVVNLKTNLLNPLIYLITIKMRNSNYGCQTVPVWRKRGWNGFRRSLQVLVGGTWSRNRFRRSLQVWVGGALSSFSSYKKRKIFRTKYKSYFGESFRPLPLS